MNRYLNLIYISAAITCLIPCTGRFAVGLILCTAILFLTVFGTMMNEFFKKFLTDNARAVCTMVSIIFLCLLFKQFVALFSPLMALYINYTIYLAALSSMMLSYFFGKAKNNDEKDISLKESLMTNTAQSLKFCIFAMVFFLLRDIIGYSTITLPAPTKFIEIFLPSIHICNDTFFWGSIPFAIFMLALIICFYSYAHKKIGILRENKKK